MCSRAERKRRRRAARTRVIETDGAWIVYRSSPGGPVAGLRDALKDHLAIVTTGEDVTIVPVSGELAAVLAEDPTWDIARAEDEIALRTGRLATVSVDRGRERPIVLREGKAVDVGNGCTITMGEPPPSLDDPYPWEKP